MQKLEITEALFGELYPFVINDSVTDIKWNGKNVWIDDLKKGRYIAKNEKGKDLKLSNDWIEFFAKKLSNTMNVNFNASSPSLQAETDELRVHIVHKFVSGEDGYSFTIRKTPSVSRLANIDLIGSGYFDEMMNAILPAIIRSRMAGCVIGDVGAGKTELEKYLCQFIPDTDGIITVEDTLEMKLPKLYPNKDIISLKVSDSYSAVDAIRDSLRLMTKWLILSEARGREIVQVMEAASTGCVAMTSIHSENAWEIPDRMMNMAGDESREGFENDIYTFFNYAVKVKKDVDNVDGNGITRKVDQLVFFSRENGKNKLTIFYKDGKLTGEKIPTSILEKMRNETDFLKLYCKTFNLEYVDNSDKPTKKMANNGKEVSDEEKTEPTIKENLKIKNGEIEFKNEKPVNKISDEINKNLNANESPTDLENKNGNLEDKDNLDILDTQNKTKDLKDSPEDLDNSLKEKIEKRNTQNETPLDTGILESEEVKANNESLKEDLKSLDDIEDIPSEEMVFQEENNTATEYDYMPPEETIDDLENLPEQNEEQVEETKEFKPILENITTNESKENLSDVSNANMSDTLRGSIDTVNNKKLLVNELAKEQITNPLDNGKNNSLDNLEELEDLPDMEEDFSTENLDENVDEEKNLLKENEEKIDIKNYDEPVVANFATTELPEASEENSTIAKNETVENDYATVYKNAKELEDTIKKEETKDNPTLDINKDVIEEKAGIEDAYSQMNNEFSFTEKNDINNEKELKGVNENTINNVEENHSNLDSLEFSLEPLPELDDIDENDSELFGGR